MHILVSQQWAQPCQPLLHYHNINTTIYYSKEPLSKTDAHTHFILSFFQTLRLILFLSGPPRDDKGSTKAGMERKEQVREKYRKYNGTGHREGEQRLTPTFLIWEAMRKAECLHLGGGFGAASDGSGPQESQVF